MAIHFTHSSQFVWCNSVVSETDTPLLRQTNLAFSLLFCAIHGISTKRVERLASNIAYNEATTAPPDLRGKHHNRPNAISDEIIQTIDTHIKSFPRRSSHYSRSKNIKKYYLSPELSVKRMHELYLERYEPEVYAKWHTTEEKLKPKVSYDFYFRYLKANFNISFGHPRSDTCQVCDKIDTQLKGKRSLPDDEIKKIETEQKIHHSKAKAFFDDLKEKAEEAQNNQEIETLCFDHQQNAPLPKVPAGDAFYLRQLWMFNFCVHSSKHNKSYFYMYDEVTAKKTPNETISFLDHYFDHIIDKEVKTVYLFSDNCGAQNKNHALIDYLYTLIKKGRFEKIVHRYPEPGHSFLPCDRSFGVVEKHIRKIERIFLPSEYVKHYKNSSLKHFVTIPVDQNMIYNFSEALSPYFKKIIINREKEKFQISKYKVLEYSREHENEIWCSKSSGLLSFSKFNIQKSLSETPEITKNKLYNQALPLKKSKYDNVMLLARKYVPLADIDFYNRLLSDEVTAQETDFTDDDANESE